STTSCAVTFFSGCKGKSRFHLILDEFAIRPNLSVRRTQTKTTGKGGNFLRGTFDFYKPAALRNMIEANRAAREAIFFAQLGIGLIYPVTEQFEDALGRFIFHRSFDFHARFVRTTKTRPFERQHRDTGAMAAQTKLSPLRAKRAVTIEKL